MWTGSGRQDGRRWPPPVFINGVRHDASYDLDTLLAAVRSAPSGRRTPVGCDQHRPSRRSVLAHEERATSARDAATVTGQSVLQVRARA